MNTFENHFHTIHEHNGSQHVLDIHTHPYYHTVSVLGLNESLIHELFSWQAGNRCIWFDKRRDIIIWSWLELLGQKELTHPRAGPQIIKTWRGLVCNCTCYVVQLHPDIAESCEVWLAPACNSYYWWISDDAAAVCVCIWCVFDICLRSHQDNKLCIKIRSFESRLQASHQYYKFRIEITSFASELLYQQGLTM